MNAHAQTTMSDAFAKAGIHPMDPPEVRLKRMMREAIRAAGGKSDPARDYFIAALVKADDVSLLWELFTSVRMAVIGRLFTETLIEMRGEPALQNAGGAIEVLPQGQSSGASPATPTEGEADDTVPQGQTGTASPSATDAAAGARNSGLQGLTRSTPAPAPQKPSRLRFEARESVARLSILRTFRKIGNKPLADVTGAEAREWLKDHQRDGRFVSLVTYHVPDEVKIGAMVPEEEADRMFKLASEAGNA